MKHKKDIKKAFVSTLPVLAGYLALGFGFGVLLSTKGYDGKWALFMSITMFGGSSQYAAVEFLADGISLLSAGIATLIINARHLFYGISLVDKYKGTGLKKIYMIHTLTDETYSLVCNDDAVKDVDNKHLYYFLVSLFDHIYWIMGCTLGAVFGTNVEFNSEGIDFALTALFLVVFLEQWLTTEKHGPSLIGVGASVLSLLIFGADSFLIPAMIGIGVMLGLYKEETA